ncbi:alpha/beta hydrolase [Aliidiomarina indica]|uniref:alpha/beta hydrolase n=1 Tax=Aliidiomarina indica TaxID=2749147 RepID=UPI00189057FB|nr:alpha/beta hydrolase [Aliidiomarina indica]
MRIAIVVAIIAIILLLVACQPTRVLNTVVPSGSYDLLSDVAYGDHDRQRMDIYVPTQDNVKQRVIVFVYGGAWDQGDKKEFEFVGQAFARLGYVTLVPNYRLYPDVEFPDFIQDVADSIAALPDAIEQHQGRVCSAGNDIVLMGHSAGAHTAAMLAVEPRYFANANATNLTISALIGLSGPYDLPLEHERVKDKFTTVEGDEANPVALAHADMPPTLLLHGEQDTVAEPAHTDKFASRLRELGVPVDVHTYDRARHVALVASLASPLRFWTPAYNDIQSFLTNHQLDTPCP